MDKETAARAAVNKLYRQPAELSLLAAWIALLSLCGHALCEDRKGKKKQEEEEEDFILTTEETDTSQPDPNLLHLVFNERCRLMVQELPPVTRFFYLSQLDLFGQGRHCKGESGMLLMNS